MDVKLRQVRVNVAEIRAGMGPEWITDIVAVAQQREWIVLHAARTVTFFPPSGMPAVSCSPADPGPLASGPRREALLRSLAQHGLPTHRSKRGFSLPGCDSNELLTAIQANNDAADAALVP